MSKNIYYNGAEIELNYTDLNHLIPHELWQCGLSLQAIGVAGYIYTLPKQWKLNITHLSKQLLISPNSCRKYLKEIFSNQKAREIFKVVEHSAINTYDFEEGLIAYEGCTDRFECEQYTSMVAKDTSEPNPRKVLLIQTKEQRYLLNLCFNAGKPKPRAEKSADNHQSPRAEAKSAAKTTRISTAQNLRTIYKNLKDSYKDSSYNARARKNKTKEKELDLSSFSEQEREIITLWLNYKQERSKSLLKPSQIDFQIRKIKRLKEQGQDIQAVIEKSLDMGWAGLFAMDLSQASTSLSPTPPTAPKPTALAKPSNPSNPKSRLRIL